MTASTLPLFAAPAAATSSRAKWGSRVLFTLVLLFLVFDTTVKLTGDAATDPNAANLGFTARHLTAIGLIELACLVLYAIPRTAPIGALLFTGYLGGAIVTHLRVDNPLFSHTLFPIYVAVLLWGALYLRDPRVRGFFATR